MRRRAAPGDELVAKGIDGDKIRVYPRGIDTRRFNPAKRNGFYKKWKCPPQTTRLIYVGRVSKFDETWDMFGSVNAEKEAMAC